MYLTHVDEFIYLLLNNVKKVILKAIKVTIIELILIKSYVSYVNNFIKFKVLNVIDIYKVITYQVANLGVRFQLIKAIGFLKGVVYYYKGFITVIT